MNLHERRALRHSFPVCLNTTDHHTSAEMADIV